MRPAWPEDWTELLTAIGDEGVVRNLASAPWPYTMKDAIGFARLPQQRLLPHFFVTLPSDKGARLIGCAGLSPYGDDVELGYWIARSHWGQGYATEAAQAVLQLAKALGHRRVVAGHFVDNPASGRVLTKAGFRRTGTVAPRYSLGRGGDAPAVEYEAVLVTACDCEDQNLMRAA
ncbi:MAG: GNAT family N-acetyltransferase [Novosphingobium sp.]